MQYILNEDEMRAFREDRETLRELMKVIPNRNKLQKMCTKIADEWPTFTGWDEKKPLPAEPWGCILTVGCEHYCDECPVEIICPNEHKSWSK